MFDPTAFEAARSRYEDELRQAERRHLLRLARNGRPSAHRRALVVLADALISLGVLIRERCEPPKAYRPPSATWR